ncbi:YkgJ family cysteine cluster protein [Cedecea sp.]|uniref:YkgJ family cysteine cluster protein n=1 Tax=Cedecea sp. TaxID=1970739 RepID=UPI002F415AB2
MGAPMDLLHSRFYPACFNAFKIKSKRQTLIVVKNWFGVSDKVSEDIKNAKRLKSVCHKGCSRCCYLHVSLIAPSVFYIAEKLKEEFSCSKLFFIRKNLNKRAGLVSEYKKDNYRARCVFHGRQTGQCVIYDYRPEPCRRFFLQSITHNVLKVMAHQNRMELSGMKPV